MKSPVFLTGATGFLGMEVMARLLEKGDREVVALVRAADDVAAQERLDDVLAKLWRDPSPYRDRARAVAGDVTSPGLGHGRGHAQRGRRGGRARSCTARPRSRSTCRSTRRARSTSRARARSSGSPARPRTPVGWTASSTSPPPTSPGITEGTFRERQLDAGQEFRNTYEQTKWEAEHVVNDASDLDPVIARPSIVMGESGSGWTPAFNVLYWPIRAFSRGLFDEVPARPEALVDVVPVDYVADALVHLLEDTSSSGVVNLVSGREACTVDDLVGHDLAPRSARSARPSSPPARPAPAPPTPTTRPPCTSRTSTWTWSSTTRAPARCSARPASACPHLTDYFPRLIEYAQTTRWGKTPLTREEAAAAHAPA